MQLVSETQLADLDGSFEKEIYMILNFGLAIDKFASENFNGFIGSLKGFVWGFFLGYIQFCRYIVQGTNSRGFVFFCFQMLNIVEHTDLSTSLFLRNVDNSSISLDICSARAAREGSGTLACLTEVDADC